MQKEMIIIIPKQNSQEMWDNFKIYTTCRVGLHYEKKEGTEKKKYLK